MRAGAVSPRLIPRKEGMLETISVTKLEKELEETILTQLTQGIRNDHRAVQVSGLVDSYSRLVMTRTDSGSPSWQTPEEEDIEEDKETVDDA